MPDGDGAQQNAESRARTAAEWPTREAEQPPGGGRGRRVGGEPHHADVGRRRRDRGVRRLPPAARCFLAAPFFALAPPRNRTSVISSRSPMRCAAVRSLPRRGAVEHDDAAVGRRGEQPVARGKGGRRRRGGPHPDERRQLSARVALAAGPASAAAAATAAAAPPGGVEPPDLAARGRGPEPHGALGARRRDRQLARSERGG